MNQFDDKHYKFQRRDNTPGKFEDDNGAIDTYIVIVSVVLLVLLIGGYFG